MRLVRGGQTRRVTFSCVPPLRRQKPPEFPTTTLTGPSRKGTGQLGADDSYEAIRYEGYGPGGVAILIEALTDNRNRTAADLRAAFSKSNGNLGETGCVGWMFNQKGVITLIGPVDEEALLEASLEGGAETYELVQLDEDTEGVEVFWRPCRPGAPRHQPQRPQLSGATGPNFGGFPAILSW